MTPEDKKRIEEERYRTEVRSASHMNMTQRNGRSMKQNDFMLAEMSSSLFSCFW
jgi:hypothetical protein